MNRRPTKSRTEYDAFSAQHTARFTASTPGHDFFAPRKKKPFSLKMVLLALLLLGLLLLVNFVSNQFVHTAHVTVPITGLTEAFDGYTLLCISDLKGASFGRDQRLLAFALSHQSFDCVLLTGDMLSLHENAQPLYDLLDQLHALCPEAPVYFIAGDSDPEVTSAVYFSGGSPFAPWVLGARQRGAQLLSSPQAITRGDQSLWLLAGNHLSLDVDTMRRQYEQQYIRAMYSGDENEIELATHNLRWLEETENARKAITDADAIITLTHTPPDAAVLASPAWRDVDLVLCGHALGGLIRLPLIGPVFIPSPSLPRYGLFPGRGTQYGLSRAGSTQLYVSPGLGSENRDYPPLFFRLANPPTVTLISLTPSSL